MKSIPHISTTGRAQTDGVDGAVFVNLGSAEAHEVEIVNGSGVSIDVKTANSAVAVPVAAGGRLTLGLSANLSEVSVRRKSSFAPGSTGRRVTAR